jgi:hypothetical protein
VSSYLCLSVLAGWLGLNACRCFAASPILGSDPTKATYATVVVLGGGFEERPFIASDLYHTGFAKMMLVSQVAESHAPRWALSRDIRAAYGTAKTAPP